MLVVLLVAAVPDAARAGAAQSGGKDESDVRARLKAYAPVKLQVDLSQIGAGDREALSRIVAAVSDIDEIYWKQMGRLALEARRAFDSSTDPVDRLYHDYIQINYGPFDIRNDNERFVATGGSNGPRLPGAGFYPEDMTKEEFQGRVRAYPELKDSFEKFNTLIRRVDGTLVAIPYESVYLDPLAAASKSLAEAAALVESASLRRYLSLRSEALVSGDYYASDNAWLDVKDNALDVVIGPIETYDDGLLGLKASYEGAALVKDAKESRSLEVYRQNMEGMARALPVEERFRRSNATSGNILEVMNVVRFSGDFNAGIKTVAASLPNDERILQDKGAKKQIYKNVLEAKFDTILQPIAQALLPKKDLPLVTREAFVTNVLLHELSHTLGVDYVVGKTDLTVRKALLERYSAIEEAKADVVGIFNMQYLVGQEIFSDEEATESRATYLASIFRSVRFGTADAHGQANALQLNFLLGAGGIDFDRKKGEFSIHPKKFAPAITALAKELLEIEGTGDYARAGELLKKNGYLDPAVRDILRKIEEIPVDVTFTYPL
jgi:peptidase M49-like protein